MKHFFFMLIASLTLVACQNEHQQFCDQAASRWCARCVACGKHFEACGAVQAKSRQDCEATVRTVCAAYDAKYTREGARMCLNALQTVSCEALETREKPSFCTQLF